MASDHGLYCLLLVQPSFGHNRYYVKWSCTKNDKDLTLKMPRKPASENAVCFCRLLNILANFSNLFCIQANSVDPDQTRAV